MNERQSIMVRGLETSLACVFMAVNNIHSLHLRKFLGMKRLPFPEARSFFITLFFLFGLISRASAEDLSRVGPWNSYLNHSTIVECANPRDYAIIAEITVKSDRNQVLAQFPFALAPFGTQHLDLSLILPSNNYGSYVIRELNPTPTTTNVVCSSTTYRFAPSGSSRAVDYAFSIPAEVPLQGVSSGVFNSYKPDGTPGVVWNFLSVVNSSDTPFRGFVQIFRQDGTYDENKSFRLPELSVGERRDFALGHPDGQVVGLYRVIPDVVTQPYSAFVTRYNPNANGRFLFAFPMLAKKPSCDEMVLPASTMDPAHNWAEIVNPGAESRTFVFSVYDALGRLLDEEGLTLAPRSQHHIYLNQFIGERAVGSFHIRCSGAPPTSEEEGLIAESAYYGRRGDSVDWAYVYQGSPEAKGGQFVHLYNTFLNAANWNKLLARDVRGGFGDTRAYDGEGIIKKLRSSPLLPNGAVDIALHEDAGVNTYGSSFARVSVGGAGIASDLLRVFPDNRGGIGYIMNVSPHFVADTQGENAAVRVPTGSRFVEIGGRNQLIVGDSLTQGWMEMGTDFKQSEFLDALQSRGVNQVMIWSYIGINDQTADSRIGYHAPRIWPWIEASNNVVPPYSFQFNTPNGEPMFNPLYFSRLREFAKGAQARGITFLITIHDGWTKDRFDGHPLNAANGGQLPSKSEFVVLATPGTEMPKAWDWNWSRQQKHQWILERFTEKLLETTSDLSNVMYEITNEGEWYNGGQLDAFERHFIDFISDRSSRIILVNDVPPLSTDFHQVNQVGIISIHEPNWSVTTQALQAFQYYSNFWFSPQTKKPIVFNEPVPSYQGGVNSRTALTRLMWGTLLAGSGFHIPDDVSWKFNPAAVDPLVDRLGYAAKFINTFGLPLTDMSPAPGLSSSGICYQKSGEHYVVYSQSGPDFTLDLSGVSGNFIGRYYNPFTGEFYPDSITLTGGQVQLITKPDNNDWVIWVSRS